VRIIVVGGSVAGIAACQALRAEGWEDEIVLISDERISYDRPPLSKRVLLGTTGPGELELADFQEFERLRIDRRSPTRAEELDLDRSVLHVDGGELAFDGLIIATGSHARLPPFPADGIHLLRTLDDALRLRAALLGAHHVVIVGAGFIGLEVASCARGLGLGVTILEYASQPMARVLPPEVGQVFAELHAAAGSEVRCEAEVVEVNGAGVCLHGGERMEADVVVAGIGAGPNDSWLAGSGLEIRDGVICDETLRAAERVYAVGDVARWMHPIYGSIRVEHWTSARDHARVAAANLTAELAEASKAVQIADGVPYFWSDQLGIKIQAAGWTPGTDVVHVRQDGARRLLLLGRADRLTAVMALDWPRELALHRRKLAAEVDFAAAIADAPGAPIDTPN
jgi:NADPH-dependent 2,4-dienoyl-CoA reductase/sulfur reductase-like enzyme